MTARLAAAAMAASSAAARPVVPMICTRPLPAMSSAKPTVALGMVKSISPSAAPSSSSILSVTAMPLRPSPASSPASPPMAAVPGASTAPASAAPLPAAIAAIRARPMRPPAPATISRMSDIGSTPGESQPRPSRLRAVVAFDHDDVDARRAHAQRLCGGVFRRMIAGERGGVILELDHHIAAAALALDHFGLPGARQKARPELAERLGVGRHIGLVGLRVGYIAAHDPIALGHVRFPLLRFALAPSQCRPRSIRRRPWGPPRSRWDALPPDNRPRP